jgi:RHS repeat-associated protein
MSFLVLVVLLTSWSAVADAQATITSISPATIQTGGSLTIFGSGFGASQGLSNSISFTGVPASPRVVANSWTATKIVVTVPASAISGTVSVVVSSRASNALPLTVTPVVNSVTPAAALPGTQVTVAGSGFGNTQAIGSGSITFNRVSVVPSTWSSTSIVVTVPSNATSGIVMATVAGQPSSSSVVFTPVPNIATISPAQAAAGTQVTINGNSFGMAQGSSSVIFNGVAAQISNWTNSTLQAVVPNTSSGPVTVHVNGVSSNSTTFAVSPGIISISPDPGMAGSPVTISGTAFGSPQGSSAITFNGLAAAVTNWSNGAIVAIVPPNVTAGQVQVTVNGMASNGVSFSLPSPYSFAIAYAPDGAILGVNDSVNGTWNYTYDDFNRLTTANRTDVPTGLGFQYDQYGNRWQQNVTGGTVGSSQMTFNPAPTAFRNGNCYHPAGLNNQPDAYCYDAAGNLVSDGVHTYTYDAENSVISVDAGQTATYFYNGMGQRVSKGTGASASEFLYDLNGNLITEVSGSGNWIRGEIYGARKHIGTYRDGTTYFTQTDWLGTERARVYFNGNLFQTCTSLPFGDGLNCSGASDPSPNHLTGKPRDLESGLDYFGARYYSSVMGRFTSSDTPLADQHIVDPQSWNLYRYGDNSPLGYIDLDGHASVQWERVKAVQIAWREERELVIKTGNGTREWSQAQIAELKETGRVKGYYGHHINNVADHAEMARVPDNIKFVDKFEHLAEHKGTWQNETTGQLIGRTKMLARLTKLGDVANALMALQTITGTIAEAATQKQTGIGQNFLGMLDTMNVIPVECYCQTILDPAKAAITLDGEHIEVLGIGSVWVHDGKYFNDFNSEISPVDVKGKDIHVLDPDKPYHPNTAYKERDAYSTATLIEV